MIAARVEERLRQHQSSIVPEYLDAAEASIFLNIAPKTLEDWRARGKGPAYNRVGRLIRYNIDELRAWMREQRVAPDGDSNE